MKILTNENYYEDDDYFSVSSFKKFMKCEVDALNGVYNTGKSEAMMVGSYVDSYVEGTLDEFIENNPEIYSTRGETKGKLKAQFKKANEVCEVIDNDETLQYFLSGDKQTIMTGEIAGVPFKIKMDSYLPNVFISDLKVMHSIRNANGNYIDFIGEYGYTIQMAVYQEIVYQNTGLRLPCYIVALTKETHVDRLVIEIEQEYLNMALDIVKEHAPRLYDVKLGFQEPVGCGVCKSCRSLKKGTEIITYSEMING